MGRSPRARAEHLGGTRIRYYFPCGHYQTIDHGKGPVAKRIGEAGCRFIVKTWERGGVTADCPTCERKRKGAA